MTKLPLTALLIFLAGTALALGPQEMALIVNANSAESMKLAREYTSLRSIPSSNIVLLDALNEHPKISLSVQDFTTKIWDPANAVLKARGINGRILAWAYSSDFPTTIETDPPMSITGITFLCGNAPRKKEEIDKAFFISPIFADPIRPDSRSYRTRSFDRLKDIHGKDMPLPAFLLAFTGERGTTFAEALTGLRKGKSADFSSPTGTIYFVKSADVRSEAREWQFPSAAAELKKMGLHCEITEGFPKDKNGIIGVISGATEVEPKNIGTFAPGAFADHLTSFAAAFSADSQTKCTAWLKAGAAGSAGTVTEPFAAWPKFPHARIFVHYASGCTLIESFYLSTRSPLQILPIGDPLCQPWAPKPEITVEGLPEGPLNIAASLNASVSYSNPLLSAEVEWYVDDTLAARGNDFLLDPVAMDSGPHSLRVVALRTGPIRSQDFLLKEFTAARK